jgi:sulfite exporter TauE/SafE
MLALPAGAAGELLVVRGFGRALAIGSGVVMLLAAANAMHVKGLDRITSRASEAAARAFAPALRFAAGRPFAGPLVTGALNGLLPCGLVYVALAAAVASGRIAAAIGLMAGFAAGTSVVLIAMAMASATMSAAARRRLRPAGPIVLVLTAIVLIGRGVAPPRHHAGGPAPAAVHVRHLSESVMAGSHPCAFVGPAETRCTGTRTRTSPPPGGGPAAGSAVARSADRR